LRIDPFADRKAQSTGNERRRQIDIDVILLEPVFVPDLEHVAEAFRREKGGPRALSLNQRIGGESRPVNDEAYLSRLDSRPGMDRTQYGEHALFRRLRRRQDLCRKSAPACFQGYVGESAADIDADPDCRRGGHAQTLKRLSAKGEMFLQQSD
jgi:hypothetical protein